MPWVFLVQGAAIRVATDAPYDLEEKLKKSEEFQKAKALAEQSGFVLRSSSNVDYPLELAVFVGKDLHPARQIYQGLTIAASAAPVENPATLESIASDIADWLRHATGETPVVEHGVILNQFD